MKNILLLFIAIACLLSCSIDPLVAPHSTEEYYTAVDNPYISESVLTPDTTQVDKPCEFMWLRYNEKTVEIMKIEGANAPGDTIWGAYEHFQYGWCNIYWIEGETPWDCIALGRYDEPLGFMVWFEGDTCRFTIPPIDNLH